MTDSEVVKDLDELRIAFAGPASAANRFFVTVGPGGVRIAFTEKWMEDAPPEFRCAAMLPVQDAIQLKDLLVQLLRPLESQNANALESDGGKNGG